MKARRLAAAAAVLPLAGAAIPAAASEIEIVVSLGLTGIAVAAAPVLPFAAGVAALAGTAAAALALF